MNLKDNLYKVEYVEELKYTFYISASSPEEARVRWTEQNALGNPMYQITNRATEVVRAEIDSVTLVPEK